MSKLSKQELLKAAHEYLGYGLSVLPLRGSGEKKKWKVPPLGLEWGPYKVKPPTPAEAAELFGRPDAGWIGVITGAVSGNLEVLDVDCKYDLTGRLWEELSGLLKDNLPAIFPSFPIAKTTGGGYHIYYRCPTIGASDKLARRPATEEERDEAFREAQEKAVKEGKDPAVIKREKVKVVPDLVETRGEGAYVVAAPSPGYQFIQGSLASIPIITPAAREVIFAISKSFHALPEEEPKPTPKFSGRYQPPGLSPFAAFNQSSAAPDIILGLLHERGWTQWRQGPRVYVKRPGATSSQSGNLHLEMNRLHIFSSSTELEPGDYSMSDIYIKLECNDDKALAARRLREQGYGDEPVKAERPTQVRTDRVRVSLVNRVNKETQVIAEPGGRLKVESLDAAQDVVIEPVEGADSEDVLKAVQLALEADRRVYVRTQEGEMREYRYYLNDLFAKYTERQGDTEDVSDRMLHELVEEVVIFGSLLQPVDREMYLGLFLSQPGVQALGLTQGSLDAAIDRLRVKADSDRQARAVDGLMDDVGRLRSQGKTKEALELLQEKLHGLKGMDRTEEYRRLSVPRSMDALMRGLKSHPTTLETGYKIGEEKILIPTGALSVLTAATGHGKTTLLINLLLRLAHRYPEKSFHFFSYEEDAAAITINTLNTYLGVRLSGNTRRNLREYFKRSRDWNRKYIDSSSLGHPQHLKSAEEGIDRFFRELVDTGRIHIHYVDYDSDELIGAVRHLAKHENPGGIFVDYMQMLRAPAGKFRTYSEQEELGAICRELKNVAVDTGLPLILAAQQSRQTINPLRLHPTNIGKAGDIERIAHLLIGFWNWRHPMLGVTDTERKELDTMRGTGDFFVRMLKNRGGNMHEGMYDTWAFDGNTGRIGGCGWDGNPASEGREDEGPMDMEDAPF